MSGPSSTPEWGNVSEDFALFRTLSSEQRLKALSAMVRRDLVRGQTLVAQGEPSDSLLWRFMAALPWAETADSAPFADLAAVDLAGETGFLPNVPGTPDAFRSPEPSVL